MKLITCTIVLLVLVSTAFYASDASAFRVNVVLKHRPFCAFPLMRDDANVTMSKPPPCHFPPADNPCAVPCRLPGINIQTVPCNFKTACPAKELPYYGVIYSNNPYAIFR